MDNKLLNVVIFGAGGSGTLEVVDHTLLTPFTGGVSLVAASGTDYAAPIPEPATWVLMIAGMGLVAGVRKRRDRAISAHSAPPITSYRMSIAPDCTVAASQAIALRSDGIGSKAITAI